MILAQKQSLIKVTSGGAAARLLCLRHCPEKTICEYNRTIGPIQEPIVIEKQS